MSYFFVLKHSNATYYLCFRNPDKESMVLFGMPETRTMVNKKQEVPVNHEEVLDDPGMTYGEMLVALADAGFIGMLQCPGWKETHYLVAGNLISILRGFRKGVLQNNELITFDQEDE